MRGSKARTGHRVGEPCHRRWSAYGKQQGKGRRKSSPRSSTTSASICFDEAFFELRKDAAPGVDGLIWTDYEQNLERNLEDLHARIHRGAYRALPSRRTYIPKPDGRQRPLAIAALEDKIVQRMRLLRVLNAIYEEDFLGFSWYGSWSRARHARRTGCARCRDREHEGELDTGRRRPIVLRRNQPAMAGSLPGTSDRRPTHHPLDPEMAQGGHPGRRGRDGQ